MYLVFEKWLIKIILQYNIIKNIIFDKRPYTYNSGKYPNGTVTFRKIIYENINLFRNNNLKELHNKLMVFLRNDIFLGCYFFEQFKLRKV